MCIYITRVILTLDFRLSISGFYVESFQKNNSKNLNISTNHTSWTHTWNKYGEDFGAAVKVDSSNNIYVGGSTISSDFPITSIFL